MHPVVAKFRTFREAEEATREYYRRLSPVERLEILVGGSGLGRSGGVKFELLCRRRAHIPSQPYGL
jgi:hypothetical protein